MAFPISPTEGQTHTENNTVWIYSAVTDQWNRSVINPLNETTYIGSDGAPGGIGGNTQVIFNDNGSLASDAGLVYNKTTDALTTGSLRATSLGTAAAPTFTFTGDPNTGIYSPGADQVAISTNGTGRLTVDTAATTSTLPVVHPLGAVGTPSITFTSDLNTGFWSPTADTLAASTAGSERLRITSDGKLGLGTSSPANPFLPARYTTVGKTLNFGQANNAAGGTHAITPVYDGVSNDLYISSRGSLSFGVDTTSGSTTEAVTITAAGRVGIGTTPVVDLDVAPAASTATFRIHARSNTTPVASIELVRGTNTTFGADGSGDYRIKNDTGNLSFEYGDSGVTTERARIDSSGRLLVGTSTARETTSGNDALAQFERAGGSGLLASATRNSNDAFGPRLAFIKSRGTAVGSNTVVQSGDALGGIVFHGADGTNPEIAALIQAEVDGTPGANDMPGRLVFSTTSDGAASPTERLRITSAGVLQVAEGGNITVGTTTGTKIGTATTQKLGFYNATPVVQPAAVADATTAIDVITQLNDLLAKLRTLGIIAT